VKNGNEGNKNGEVVGPAGGETGEPRCLAEVHLLSEATLYPGIKEPLQPLESACLINQYRHCTCIRVCLPPHATPLIVLIISGRRPQRKIKTGYFWFFSRYRHVECPRRWGPRVVARPAGNSGTRPSPAPWDGLDALPRPKPSPRPKALRLLPVSTAHADKDSRIWDAANSLDCAGLNTLCQT
jgi:hypothetical protein